MIPKRCSRFGTVTFQEAQATLVDLAHQLPPGDKVVITGSHLPDEIFQKFFIWAFLQF